MNEALEGLRETITLNKVVEYDGAQVLSMVADVRSEPESQMNYTISILNNTVYAENLDYFKEEIRKFKEVVNERESYLFSFYYPEDEEKEHVEEAEEESEDDGVEEAIDEGGSSEE